jgi:uncharacterized membrane protein
MPNDYEENRRERAAQEKKHHSFILQCLMAGWISFYVLTFFIWLGAIWASPLKLFVTGLLTLVVGICLTVLWAFLMDKWDR